MKADWRAVFLSLAVLAANDGLRAQSATNPSASENTGNSSVDLRAETKKLAIADAKKIAELSKARATTAVPNDPGVVTMDPFIVRDQKLPNVVIPKFETPFMHLWRTGTILYSPGKRITTKLWFEHENAPHNFAKPELRIKFSW